MEPIWIFFSQFTLKGRFLKFILIFCESENICHSISDGFLAPLTFFLFHLGVAEQQKHPILFHIQFLSETHSTFGSCVSVLVKGMFFITYKMFAITSLNVENPPKKQLVFCPNSSQIF